LNNDSFDLLHFNKSRESPLLTIGWRAFAETHQLPDNVEIQLAYYGQNIFQIQTFTEALFQNTNTAFHSRSLFPLLTNKFEIMLTNATCNLDKLVCTFSCF
jgi:hypothetical protein